MAKGLKSSSDTGASNATEPAFVGSAGFEWIDAAIEVFNRPENILHFQNKLQEDVAADPMQVFKKIALPIASLKALQSKEVPFP